MKPLTKAAAWLALGVLGWAVLAGYVALWFTSVRVAQMVTMLAAGVTVGLLVDRPRRLEREFMARQLDQRREAAVVVERGAGVLPPERAPWPLTTEHALTNEQIAEYKAQFTPDAAARLSAAEDPRTEPYEWETEDESLPRVLPGSVYQRRQT